MDSPLGLLGLGTFQWSNERHKNNPKVSGVRVCMFLWKAMEFLGLSRGVRR